MTQDSAGIVERLRNQAGDMTGNWDGELDSYAETDFEAAAHIEAQDAEIDRLHGILKAVISDTRGPLVGGGDGCTFIVRPISGETYNKIHAALKGAKP